MHFNYVAYDGDGRTLFLECLSLAASALILHGISSGSKYSLMPGRLFFGLAMIVFGIQHFLYVRFLATLVPRYLPGHHLWILGTGLALIAAGLSIATTIEDKYAAYGLFAPLLRMASPAPRASHPPRPAQRRRVVQRLRSPRLQRNLSPARRVLHRQHLRQTVEISAEKRTPVAPLASNARSCWQAAE